MIEGLLNVSIVLYNANYEEVSSVIDEILKSDYLNKLYVVDNSSVNDSRYASYHDGRFEYVFNGSNIGYGAGHNIAIKRSFLDGVKYHLVMNYDIVLNHSIFERLIKRMEMDSTIGLMMPKILNDDGSCQVLPKIMPTPYDLMVRVLSPLNRLFADRHDRYTLKRYMEHEIHISNLSGCFSFFRVEALKKVGIYDESFFMYFEDNDLTRRILRKYEVIYNPAVSIIHSHGRGATKNARLFWIFLRSACHYFFKYGWFFDKERDEANRYVIKNLTHLKPN